MVSSLINQMEGADSEHADVSSEVSHIEFMERTLQQAVKMVILRLIKEDDANRLEEVLLAERNSDSTSLTKKSKKKKKKMNGIKEDNDFFVLGRQMLHYACALDSVECCKLLLMPHNFPRIKVDTVDEIDHRSSLHFACLYHSKLCVEVLLKQGASVTLKNKQLMLPLEEFFASPKLHVAWDLTSTAAEIVERVGKQDLSILRLLEPKCKDQLTSVAFKLAKDVKLVPLVALLHIARNSIVNSLGKNSESEEESTGTLVDYLLGKVLVSSSVDCLEKLVDKLSNRRKFKSDGVGDSWSGEASCMYRKILCEGEGNSFEVNQRNSKSDWPGGISETRLIRKDLVELQEAPVGIKDMKSWEDRYYNSCGKFVGGGHTVEESNMKVLAFSVGEDTERIMNKNSEENNSVIVEDLEKISILARKVLECILLFKPRLSAHSQSTFAPPLLRAAQSNDEGIVDLLLHAGASVNETDADGNTALHWALRQTTTLSRPYVNCKMVQRLLEAGGNAVVGNKLGATPVHTAAGHGQFDALSLILQKESAGVNVMAATKETPLHYSVKNNHFLCTALLLKHGANKNVISLRNQKPYQLATSSEMKLLLSIDEKTIHERSLEELVVLCSSHRQLTVSQESPLLSGFSFVEPPHVKPLHCSREFSSQGLNLARSISQVHFTPVQPQVPDHLQRSLLSCLTQSPPLSFSQSVKNTVPPVQMRPRSQLQSLPLPNSSDSNEVFNSSPWPVVNKASSHLSSTNGLHLHSGEREVLGKQNVNLPAYKTVLCRLLGSSTGCTWGNLCHFAHSEEELRLGQQRLKFGGQKNEESPSSHGLQIAGDGNYKTKLCVHYEKMKMCPHNGKCKFAHGEAELRTSSVFSSIGPNMRSGPRPSTASSLGSSGSEDGEEVNSRKIFVGGLPPYVTSEDLSECFEEEFGKVVEAAVIYGTDDEGNVRSRGFGFVLFDKQKDADEAVKRHFFPVRGKKVEVKKAMVRFDSVASDERGKPEPDPTSELSSPTGSLSPAPQSVGAFIDDGLHLPASLPAGGYQAWSLTSVSTDTTLVPHNGSQESQKYLETAVQTAQPRWPPTVDTSSKEEFGNFGKRKNFSPYESSPTPYENSQPFCDRDHSVFEKLGGHLQNRISPNPISCPLKTLPVDSYSSYSSSPSNNSPLFPSTPNLPSSHPLAIHYGKENFSSSLFSSSSVSLIPKRNDFEQSADDDELSGLLTLLKVGKSSSTSQPTFTVPSTCNQKSDMASLPILSSTPSTSSFMSGYREALPATSQVTSAYVPYPGVSANAINQKGITDSDLSKSSVNFTKMLAGLREADDALKYDGTFQSLLGNPLHNDASQTAWGHRESFEARSSSIHDDPRMNRVIPGGSTAHSSNILSSLLPTYNSSVRATNYNGGFYSRFGISG